MWKMTCIKLNKARKARNKAHEIYQKTIKKDKVKAQIVWNKALDVWTEAWHEMWRDRAKIKEEAK